MNNYRVKEYNGIFTIERRRLKREQRLFRVKQIEYWDNVDINGDFMDKTLPFHNHVKMSETFDNLQDAQDKINQLERGTVYHYPNKSEPLKEGQTKSNVKKHTGTPRMGNPPPPPKPTVV